MSHYNSTFLEGDSRENHRHRVDRNRIRSADVLWRIPLHITPNPDAIEKATTPSAPIFSPVITLIVAVLAVIGGFLVLKFGGQGYSEKAVKPASSPKR